jgi:hypothetical protein
VSKAAQAFLQRGPNLFVSRLGMTAATTTPRPTSARIAPGGASSGASVTRVRPFSSEDRRSIASSSRMRNLDAS